MALPALNFDMTGNTEIQDAQRFSFNANTGAAIPSATQPYICAGTGDPTFSAPKGSLYIKIDATTTTTRLWINTTGSTTWTNVGTAGA